MRRPFSLLLVLAVAVSACSDAPKPTAPSLPPPPPPPPPIRVLLQDLEIPNLPSPYFHFEYDATGRVTGVSFASRLRAYDVTYDGDKIRDLRSTAPADGDTLRYSYDDEGRVGLIRYVNRQGQTTTRVFFAYQGTQLVGISRERVVEGGALIDKTVSLSYYTDGNLRDITVHRPLIDAEQGEATTTDHFEQYDDKVNVDGFSLIHDEFFDHVLLLPGVQLQYGNPARQVHGGDGVNFTVDYHYTYDDRGRPLSKNGELTFLNGPQAGQRFQTSSLFSYY